MYLHDLFAATYRYPGRQRRKRAHSRNLTDRFLPHGASRLPGWVLTLMSYTRTAPVPIGAAAAHSHNSIGYTVCAVVRAPSLRGPRKSPAPIIVLPLARVRDAQAG